MISEFDIVFGLVDFLGFRALLDYLLFLSWKRLTDLLESQTALPS